MSYISNITVDKINYELKDAEARNSIESLNTEIAKKIDADNLADVAKSGEFSDLNNIPTTLAGYGITDAATSNQGVKADNAIHTIQIGGNIQTKTNGVVNLPAYPTTLPASDVKSWAKADNKPSYTASEVGALASTVTHLSGDIATSEKGAANGVATLGSDGKVPSTQLPSYVDDVLEYTGKSKFPTKGETGKIYVDTTTNITYRWSGSVYTEISSSLALGEISSTAYRGDRGKIAYDHSQSTHARTDATKVEKSSINGNIKINGTETTVYTHPSGTNPHGTTKSDVGLGNVDNTKDIDKPISTKQQEKFDEINSNLFTKQPFDKLHGYFITVENQLRYDGNTESIIFKVKKGSKYTLTYNGDRNNVGFSANYPSDGSPLSNVTLETNEVIAPIDGYCIWYVNSTLNNTISCSVETNNVGGVASEIVNVNESLGDYGIKSPTIGKWSQGRRNTSISTIETNALYVSSDAFEVMENDEITFTYNATHTYIYINYFNIDGTYKDTKYVTTNSVTFTVPNGVGYACVVVRNDVTGGITPSTVSSDCSLTVKKKTISQQVNELKNDLSNLQNINIITNKLGEWTAGGTAGTVPILDVTYGKGKFVAGCGTGDTYYSTDGITWTAGGKVSGSYAIAYANGKFVSVGTKKNAYYSTDGINWIDSGTIIEAFVNAIAYGNGKFVVVCDDGINYHSEDGITWTAGKTAGKNDLHDVVYANGKFVAVGYGIYYSTDGISWTACSSVSKSFFAVAYGNDKFVAVGVDGINYHSEDGITWTAGKNAGVSSDRLTGAGMSYGNGKFVVVGNIGQTYYSTDGITWTSGGTNTNLRFFRNMIYANGKFVAVGNAGKTFYLPFISEKRKLDDVINELIKSVK